MDHKEFTVRDRLGPLRFRGTLLSDKRWTAGQRPRWTDMALYVVDAMAHDRTLKVRVECEGCRPVRTLSVEQGTFEEGPILCGRCEKPFIPADRQEEEPIRYALEITARSRVYHRVGSPCVRSKHKIRRVGEIEHDPERWAELLACRESGCRPGNLNDMDPADRIAEERDDPKIYLCTDASAVIRKLYRRNGEITELAAKLLRDAAAKDADIAAAVAGRRRI